MSNIERLWGAVLWPIGQRDIFGGVWDNDQLYLTRTEAIRDIEEHAIEIGLLPIEWSCPDEKFTLGRTHRPGSDQEYALMVRSDRVPRGVKVVPTE